MEGGKAAINHVMAQRRAIPWPLYLMLLMIFNCEHAFIV
jgi:hypothetical protein